jgi:predicted amidophosphoribosyltransferase
VHCPGCGRWDETLCRSCAETLTGAVRRCEADVPRLDRLDGRPPLPVWAVTPYVGPVRGIVVAWKDRGRTDLTRTLAATARRAATEVAPFLADGLQGDLHSGLTGGVQGGVRAGTVVVVPVPSAPGARRRRGADLVAVLADAAVQGLSDAGVDARRTSVLARRRSRDQVGLGARARRRNASGSVRLRGGQHVRPGEVHLLVDDVVTTGSTLAACETVLSAAGARVLGAVVLAATPSPASARDRVPDPVVRV